MLSATRLREEHDNDFDDRPQRIQALRTEIATYCDLDVPRSVAAVDEWYRAHKSVISRRLNDALDDGDGDGDDTGSDGGGESG